MKIPTLDDANLAYETGVHLGDGCLSHYLPHHYRYAISGNRQNEQEFYYSVLGPLVHSLYDLNPLMREARGSIFLCVYSKELVEFKHEAMGMPIGRKSQLIRLPDYINDSNDSWVGHFLAGLYDTDGSLKLRKTPGRNYPRISFAQKVQGVVSDVKSLLWNRFSISSTMYQNTYFDARTGSSDTRWFLDINGYENYNLFMQKIGARNPYVAGRIISLGLQAS